MLRTRNIPLWEDARFLVWMAMITGTVLAITLQQIYFLGLGPATMVIWLGFQNIKAIYFLLLATIPFSAEVEISQVLGTDLPDEPLMWFLSLLLFLHAIAYRRSFFSRPFDPAIFTVLAFHLIWIAFSCLLSTHILFSLKFFAAKLWYVVAFTIGSWYCLQDRTEVRKAAWVLAISMCASTCIALIKHASLGFTFASANQSVEPLFRNHVNYAALLVCLTPILAAAWQLLPHRRKMLRWMIWIAALGLFFSYSRGGWLAAIVGVITLMAAHKRILHWVITVALAGIVGLSIYFLQNDRYMEYSPNYERIIWHSELGQHMQATYKMTDISSMERFYRWIAAVRMLESKTLHGYGPNTFYHEYRPFTVNAFRTYVSDNPERSTVHNYFLLTLVEQGIPGLVIFCLLLAILTRRAYCWYHRAASLDERVIPAVILSMLGMIVFLNMLSDLIETDKIGSLFFICTGLLLQRGQKAYDETETEETAEK